MRTLVRQALVNDATLQALGIDSGAKVLTGDIDTPPQTLRPFINLKWGTSRIALAKTDAGFHLLTVWVHDQPNDYSRIVAIQRRIREVLTGLEATLWEETSPWNAGDPSAVSSSGWLIEVKWETGSQDLSDDGHNTITRNDVFTLIGN